MASIPLWHEEIVEIVYMLEKELLTSFMELHVHLLIHIVYEVELVGVISYCWMLFLDRYMSKLKDSAKKKGQT